MIYDDEMTKEAITANYVKRMLSILDGISLEEISGEEDDCEDSITVYKEYLEKIENQEYDICDLELQKQEMEAIYNSWEVIDEDVKEQIDDFFAAYSSLQETVEELENAVVEQKDGSFMLEDGEKLETVINQLRRICILVDTLHDAVVENARPVQDEEDDLSCLLMLQNFDFTLDSDADPSVRQVIENKLYVIDAEMVVDMMVFRDCFHIFKDKIDGIYEKNRVGNVLQDSLMGWAIGPDFYTCLLWARNLKNAMGTIKETTDTFTEKYCNQEFDFFHFTDSEDYQKESDFSYEYDDGDGYDFAMENGDDYDDDEYDVDDLEDNLYDELYDEDDIYDDDYGDEYDTDIDERDEYDTSYDTDDDYQSEAEYYHSGDFDGTYGNSYGDPLSDGFEIDFNDF